MDAGFGRMAYRDGNTIARRVNEWFPIGRVRLRISSANIIRNRLVNARQKQRFRLWRPCARDKCVIVILYRDNYLETTIRLKNEGNGKRVRVASCRLYLIKLISFDRPKTRVAKNETIFPKPTQISENNNVN